MGIPFIDLKTQFKQIEPEVRQRMDDVLVHGRFIMGPEVFELEEKLAEFAGVKHCVSCSSGTDALLMALMAYDVGPGDAVFTTPFTFIATAEVIALLGATPVFVDIDPVTFNMDPAKLESAIQALKTSDSDMYPLPRISSSSNLTPNTITPNTSSTLPLTPNTLTPRGVITVDLFGLPCDYDQINPIAEKEDLFVLEDAAQSFGAEYKGKKACSLTEMGCTSFFPAKPLGCFGDGGAVFTSRDDLAEKLTSIRVHGQGLDKYENVRLGINGRMDTLQAAMLIPKLAIFPEELNQRQRVAQSYSNHITHNTSHLSLPLVPKGHISAWAQYSILAKDPDHRTSLQARLKDKGIPTAIYYPKPLHLQGAFSHLGYKSGDFPVSEECATRIFSLPMHPYLEEEEIKQITGMLNAGEK